MDEKAPKPTPYASAKVAGINKGEYASYFALSKSPFVTIALGS
jgi:hypothetical protein